MIGTLTCEHCGEEYSSNTALKELCPRCLFANAFEEKGDGWPPISDDTSGRPRFQPPKVSQLAQFFPSLEVLELVGYGGMSAVYKARQPKLDRLVALKVLPFEVGASGNGAERFSREAKTLAKLSHPGIVSLFEYGHAGEWPYLLMEYVDGPNLRQIMGGEPLSSQAALNLVRAICDTLQYAHDQGVIHRDIKPENILLTANGELKLVDFGLAKFITAYGPTITAPEQVLGTFRYMAPEQLQSSQSVDCRADLYAVGIVLYELLTGGVPVGSFQPPSKTDGVDPKFDEIVRKALEREPERRYQEASEIKSAIEQVTAASGHTQREEPSCDAPQRLSGASAPTEDSGERLLRFLRLGLGPITLFLAYILCLYHFFYVDGSRYLGDYPNYYEHRIGQPDPWLTMTYRRGTSGLVFRFRFDTGAWAILACGLFAYYGYWRFKHVDITDKRRFRMPWLQLALWIAVATIAVGSGCTPDLHDAMMKIHLPRFGG